MSVAAADDRRVFTDPVTAGDRVTITASAYDRVAGLGTRAGRPVALIDAGPDGVRVKPVIDAARICMTVIAGALAVWAAQRLRTGRLR
jgi:hypothetical protein